MKQLWKYGLAICVVGTAFFSEALPMPSTSLTGEGGVELVPDSSRPWVYFYTRPPPELAVEQTLAPFRFFKFVGRDEGITGGILSFTLHFPRPADGTLTRWKSRLPGRAELKPIPVRRMKTELVLLSLDMEQEVARVQTESEAPWYLRTFSLRLNQHSATLVDRAFELEQNLAVSFNLDFETEIHVPYQESDGTYRYEKTNWTNRLSYTLPVSKKEYPEYFKEYPIEFADQTSLFNRVLEIRCYDFVNQTFTNLERVVVDVRIRSPRGQTHRERAKFSEQSNREDVLEFRVPEKIGSSYHYRTTRWYSDGTLDRSDWEEGHDFMIDATHPNEVQVVEVQQ